MQKKMKLYSVTMTETELKLFSEFLLDSKNYSERKDKDGDKSVLKTGDKLSVKMYKNLYTPKARKANIEALDEESRDYRPLAKRHAKIAAIATPILTAGTVAATTKILGGSSMDQLETLKETALPIVASAPLAGLASYAKTRINGEIVNEVRDRSESYDHAWQKNSDLIKVADGQMSEEEFAEKYYKKKEDKKKK